MKKKEVWYTGGIRVAYGGYTEVCKGILRYTQYIVSIALIKVYGGIRRYTEVYGSIRKYMNYTLVYLSIALYGVYGGIQLVYGWYTGGIRCQL